MLSKSHSYHRTLRKYVVLFGNMFNDIIDFTEHNPFGEP